MKCVFSLFDLKYCAGDLDVFFFQAEDGIRDDLVTGVQTCALPISFDCDNAATHRKENAFKARAVEALSFAQEVADGRTRPCVKPVPAGRRLPSPCIVRCTRRSISLPYL